MEFEVEVDIQLRVNLDQGQVDLKQKLVSKF